MLRRLHLLLAALAMLVAPLAMQSGMAMAAMPMDHGEMAQTGHCGDEDAGDDGDGDGPRPDDQGGDQQPPRPAEVFQPVGGMDQISVGIERNLKNARDRTAYLCLT